MGCLDAISITALSDGRLDGDARDTALEHVAGCSDCARSLRETERRGAATVDLGGAEAKTRESGATHRAQTARPLGGGDVIGPYTLADQLGEGGMGTVFTARHRELERDVALKLIRADDDDASAAAAQARLLREAQAMARLDHPNIVTVFDAGTWHGRVYLAMERIDGRTLRAWLKETPRAWRQIREAFVHAGRGLAAAHAAGIVHRDFKPANVLVGRDERVRVTDFGLARAAGGDTAPRNAKTDAPADRDATPTPSALAAQLTIAGTVMGTPGYMAPEQRDGQPGDARADQYSFCVSLYQALYGERPYDADLAPSTGDVVRAPLRGVQVPRFLRRALLRGLSIEPSHRFPSMDALLAELERDPGRRARRIALGVAALAALAVVIAVARRGEARGVAGCEPGAGLAGIWDVRATAELIGSFGVTGSVVAMQNVRPVLAVLDRHAAAWDTLRRETCRRSEDRADESVYLTLACLRQRRTELATLANVLVHADVDVAVNGVDTVSRLEPPGRCADPRALAAMPKPPSDPAQEIEVEAVRGALERERARFYRGDVRAELDALDGLAKRATQLGYKPLEAEVAIELGLRRFEFTGVEEGQAELMRGESIAEAGGADRLAGLAAAWIGWGYIKLARVSDARQWLDRAHILLERIGGDPDLESQIEGGLAQLEQRAGHVDASIEHAHRAVEILEHSRGADDQWTANAKITLSSMLLAARRFAEGRDVCHGAIDSFEHSYGSMHTELASFLANAATAEILLGDYAAALADAQRGASIALAALGPSSRTYLVSACSTGEAMAEQGRFDEARAIAENLEGIIASAHASDDDDLACALDLDAQAQLGQGRAAQAVELEHRVAAMYAKLDADELGRAGSELVLGMALRSAGQPAAAISSLEHAASVFERAPPWWEGVARSKLELARALGELHRDPMRALSLAREAKLAYTHVPHRPAEAASADAWLAGHPAP